MTNDKDCAALGDVKTGRFTVEDSLFVEVRALIGSHVYLWQTSPDSGIEAQITLSRDGALAFGRELVARLSAPRPAFDAALLDRAELAWQRFFYPAADNFTAPLGNKLRSVDLEVADCLRLVLAAMGRHVVTPKFDVPAIQNVARDAQLKTVAEKLAAFTGAPYEDWRHFTVEAGDILDRLDNLPTNAAPQPAFDAAGVREACAKVADGNVMSGNDQWSAGHDAAARKIAHAIRSLPLS